MAFPSHADVRVFFSFFSARPFRLIVSTHQERLVMKLKGWIYSFWFPRLMDEGGLYIYECGSCSAGAPQKKKKREIQRDGKKLLAQPAVTFIFRVFNHPAGISSLFLTGPIRIRFT